MQVRYAHVGDYEDDNHQRQRYEPVTDQRTQFKGADVEVWDWVLSSFGQNDFGKGEY